MARMGREEVHTRFFLGITEGKKPRHRSEDNIKMGF